MARIIFTHHAVERFIRRHAPEMEWMAARALLEERAESAVRLRERSVLGQVQWSITDPSCILVTKHDPGARGDVCVTVLPAPDTAVGFPDDEMAIIREAASRMTHGIPPPVEPPAKPPPISRSQPRAPQMPVSLATAPQVARSERAMANQALHIAALERAAVRDREKTARHLSTMDLEIAKHKRCLRVAVRYLVRQIANGDEYAREIAEEIQQIDPGFVTMAFLGAQKKETG